MDYSLLLDDGNLLDGTMNGTELKLYEPLNVPKGFGEDVWIVDGPIVGMAMYGTAIPFHGRGGRSSTAGVPR